MPISKTIWPRCFAHVDMLAFFASVEQLDFPELRGKPVVVINSGQGTTIITSSYEARAFGIKTGSKLTDAKAVCPNLEIRVSRSHRYAEISNRVFYAIEQEITPDIEIFSIDEVFLDLGPILSLYDSIEALAEKIQSVVSRASGGIGCSVGISEGKLTAKFCSKKNKGKATIVPPDDIKQYMSKCLVSDICGVGPSLTQYLFKHGVKYCHEMQRIPMHVLSSKMGNIGKRIYQISQGHDPEPLQKEEAPKSMGHSKILEPNTRDYHKVRAILHVLTLRLSDRLKANNMVTDQLTLCATTESGTVKKAYALTNSNSAKVFWGATSSFIDQCKGFGLFKVSIQAGKLYDAKHVQADLFSESAPENESAIDQVKSDLKEKFGKSLITTADSLSAGETNQVISPAWRDKFDKGMTTKSSNRSVDCGVQKILSKSGKVSNSRLSYQLKQAGLDEDAIAIELRDARSDQEKMELVVEPFIIKRNGEISQKEKEKLAAKLARKGFSVKDAFRCIGEMIEKHSS